MVGVPDAEDGCDDKDDNGGVGVELRGDGERLDGSEDDVCCCCCCWDAPPALLFEPRPAGEALMTESVEGSFAAFSFAFFWSW